MARERRGFIVTQVWAEIAYTDHTGQQRKITKPATAQASDKTSQNLKDAEKQKRKIEHAKSIIRDTIAELKQSGATDCKGSVNTRILARVGHTDDQGQRRDVIRVATSRTDARDKIKEILDDLEERRRKERADRIVRLLAAIEAAPELLESSYGWLTLTAETMKRSKATASRDFQLARRIHTQFVRMFGRKLEVKMDQILWSWDWSHYGFRTRESYQAGYPKAVGHFPFDTRAAPSEEAFCGLGPSSWKRNGPHFESMNIRQLISTLKLLNRQRSNRIKP